ncbi:unnamed protein product [Brassica oleracea]|uniref:uncharacterized protein LOC106320655 n=1 Tax=Brassica oleracea var. oleracea TaxID=109376 RepID=UPI0006A72FC7|nr:PREDICTED: uncharacterized protein LOC106320655 [Brassica oleracea var. oleracea]
MFSKKATSSKGSSSKGSSSKGSSSEGSTTDHSPIVVNTVWDQDNAKLPPSPYQITNLRGFIEMSLKRINPRFQLGELVATGSKNLFFPPDIEYRRLSRRNMLCEGDPKSPNCYDFIVEDDDSNEVKVMRNTDIADMEIIKDIILRAHGKEKHILILAGDKDYLHLIQQFTLGTGIAFMLAVNDVADPRLLNAPCTILRWNSVVYGQNPFA